MTNAGAASAVTAAAMLNDLLSYDPETGNLIWRKTLCSAAPKGSVAGCTLNTGYRQIKIAGKKESAHRLVWMLHNGRIPDGMQIDHVDGNRLNNRIENLRLASPSQNQGNQKRRIGKSLPKGVHLSGRKANPYRSKIMVEGVCYDLGCFRCPTAAHIAYVTMARRLHGEYARAE